MTIHDPDSPPARETAQAQEDFRNGCSCGCCEHGEGSDYACECHASGLCSVMAPNELEQLIYGVEQANHQLISRRGHYPSILDRVLAYFVAASPRPAEPEQEPTCSWSFDGELWSPSCDPKRLFGMGDCTNLADDGFRFCQFCGKPLQEEVHDGTD